MKLSKRQQEIVDISVGLIASSGIQNLTMKNISAEIGISEPAIYRHFKSKFEILLTVLESFEKIASDVLSSSEVSSLSSLKKIEFFLMDRYKRCTANPKLAKIMFSEENFQYDERLAKKILNIMHSHKQEMHGIIQLGQKNDEIRSDIDTTSMFRIIFGSMRLLIKQWGLSGYKFDLESEGLKLWNAEKKLIKGEKNET